jgi:hypothetical protein
MELKALKPLAVAGLAAGILLPAGLHAHAGVEYVDASGLRGIGIYNQAAGYIGGVAAADYDDDGAVDLFVANALGFADQLYRNLGDGSYEEVAAAAGVASTANSRGGLFFDYDGDGDLDLVVARDYNTLSGASEPIPTLKLYRNDGGAFTDVTAAAGLALDLLASNLIHSSGLCAGDIDGDGHLDLCYTQWHPSGPPPTQSRTHLFGNNGNGTFTNLTMSSGVGVSGSSFWQPVLFDVNGDGLLDLFNAVDFFANRLWINQGNRTFVNIAPAAGVSSAWNEMGVALGDYDNDGDLDLFVTNIAAEIIGQMRHNLLYRNVSTPGTVSFVDVSLDAGVDDTGWGWGTTFLDVDNDGWLDLAATNGSWGSLWEADPSRLFRNLGGPTPAFEDISEAAGFNDTYIGSGLAAFDSDRDGDLDLVQTCLAVATGPDPFRLLENQFAQEPNEHHHLVVKPRMPGPNRRAIGANVRVEAGGLTMMRPITAGISMFSQEPAEAFFGLGTATEAEVVTVEWPDGTTTTLQHVAADQVIVVEPCPPAGSCTCPADLDGSGAVDVQDLIVVLLDWGAAGGPGDIDGSGVVDVQDLIAVLLVWGPC